MKWGKVNHNCYELSLGNDGKIIAKYNLDASNGVGPLDNTFFSLSFWEYENELENITYYPFVTPHIKTTGDLSFTAAYWKNINLVEGLPQVMRDQLDIIWILGRICHIK